MKFEEAFDKVFEEEKIRQAKKGSVFEVQAKTVKILTFFWNMLKAANGKLDDFVAVDENNNIIQIEKHKGSKKPKKPKEPKEPKEQIKLEEPQKSEMEPEK